MSFFDHRHFIINKTFLRMFGLWPDQSYATKCVCLAIMAIFGATQIVAKVEYFLFRYYQSRRRTHETDLYSFFPFIRIRSRASYPLGTLFFFLILSSFSIFLRFFTTVVRHPFFVRRYKRCNRRHGTDIFQFFLGDKNN